MYRNTWTLRIFFLSICKFLSIKKNVDFDQISNKTRHLFLISCNEINKSLLLAYFVFSSPSEPITDFFLIKTVIIVLLL